MRLFCFSLILYTHFCLAAGFLPAPLLDVEDVLAARHFASESYLHAS